MKSSHAVRDALATLGQMFLDNSRRSYTGARCAKILARASVLLTQGEGADKTDAAYTEAPELDGVLLAAPRMRALLAKFAAAEESSFGLTVAELHREARALAASLKAKSSKAVRHG